jgi:hypothetical protein
MNNLGDDCLQPYITRHDYEKSLTTEYGIESSKKGSVLEDLTYHGIADGLMAKLHQKYNLRPRNRVFATVAVKKILPRYKIDEPVSKSTEK